MNDTKYRNKSNSQGVSDSITTRVNESDKKYFRQIGNKNYHQKWAKISIRKGRLFERVRERVIYIIKRLVTGVS